MCLDGGKIGRNRAAKATQQSEPRPIERESGSWFQYGACSATIGTEFGSHLGNVR